MKRFICYRLNPPEGYIEQGYALPPEEPQFEGVVFSDGSVCLHWLTLSGSHAIWPSLDDVMKIHGHPEYGTRIDWLD